MSHIRNNTPLNHKNWRNYGRVDGQRIDLPYLYMHDRAYIKRP